jgi:hypothetical protein
MHPLYSHNASMQSIRLCRRERLLKANCCLQRFELSFRYARSMCNISRIGAWLCRGLTSYAYEPFRCVGFISQGGSAAPVSSCNSRSKESTKSAPKPGGIRLTVGGTRAMTLEACEYSPLTPAISSPCPPRPSGVQRAERRGSLTKSNWRHWPHTGRTADWLRFGTACRVYCHRQVCRYGSHRFPLHCMNDHSARLYNNIVIVRGRGWMPRIDVVFYQEDGRDVPVLDCLKELRRTDQRAYESCVAAIGRLSETRTQFAATSC